WTYHCNPSLPGTIRRIQGPESLLLLKTAIMFGTGFCLHHLSLTVSNAKPSASSVTPL
ncbi:unnamed protein product, partial [Fasciola hepatica]